MNLGRNERGLEKTELNIEIETQEKYVLISG
jgi:hypothetical protein